MVVLWPSPYLMLENMQGKSEARKVTRERASGLLMQAIIVHIVYQYSFWLSCSSQHGRRISKAGLVSFDSSGVIFFDAKLSR